MDDRVHTSATEARSTYDVIAQAARRAPEAEAIVFLPKAAPDGEAIRLTRQEFLARVTQAAKMFASLGVGPSDVVSMLLPNVLDAQFVFWGAEAAGIVNPINFLLSPEHIADVMNAAGTKVLVALGPHPALDIWEKVETVKPMVPTLETTLVVGGNAPDGALPLGALMKEQSGEPSAVVGNKSSDDIAAFFHTGGTTGAPKLVQHTHANQVHAALTTAEAYAFDENDTIMCGLPLFHVAGPMLLTLAPLSAGTRVVMPTPAGNRDPELLRNYWQVVEKFDVTIMGGVPTSLNDILGMAGDAEARPERGGFCVAGGAQLTIGLEERFVRETGWPIHQIYGMTETAGVIAATPRWETPRLGAIGKPVRGVEVKVAGFDASGVRGSPCAPGQPGAVWVRGPNVTAGYYRGKSGAAAATDAKGWLDTGDLGYLDRDGWLYLTGRAKDVIIRSGHNIDPASIEEVAEGHPQVSQAVAVGRPDLRAGEVPVVFAVLNDGATASAEELLNYVIDNIPEAPAKPASLFIEPRIPVTAIGKVFRPALRRQAVCAFVIEKFQETFPPGEMPEIAIDESCEHAIRVLICFDSGRAKDKAVRELGDWLSQHTFEHVFV